MVGSKGGPKKSDMEEPHKWLEGGYMCGSKVPDNKFYVQRNFFVVTILSHNIKTTWVGINQIIVAKAEV